MYSPAGDRPVRAGQGGARPGRRAQPRRARAAGAGRRRRPGGRGAAPPRRAGAGLPARRRRLLRRGAPLHRRRQVPGRPAGAGGVMCPSWPATREEKDTTRGRARVLQEMLAPGGPVQRLARARGARRARPVPVVQGLLARLPDRRRHGDLQGRGAAPVLPAPAAPAPALHAGPAAALGRPRRPGPPAGQRGRSAPGSAAGWPSGRPGWTSAATCRRSPARTFRQQWADARRRRPATARRWRCGSTRSPTTSPPRWRSPRSGCWRRPATGCRCPATTPAAGSPGSPPASSTPPARILGRDGARRWPPLVDAGIPVVGVEPSCTAVLRGDALELVGGPEARAGRRRHPHAGRAAGRRPRAGRRRPWPGSRSSPSRTATTPRCWAGRPTPRCWPAPGRGVTRLGGCCGLAGNWGVERGHHDVSVAIAEQQLLPAVRDAGPDAVVLADGFSCRTQLDQLAGRRGQHLAAAAGRPPPLTARVRRRRRPGGRGPRRAPSGSAPRRCARSRPSDGWKRSAENSAGSARERGGRPSADDCRDGRARPPRRPPSGAAGAARTRPAPAARNAGGTNGTDRHVRRRDDDDVGIRRPQRRAPPQSSSPDGLGRPARSGPGRWRRSPRPRGRARSGSARRTCAARSAERSPRARRATCRSTSKPSRGERGGQTGGRARRRGARAPCRKPMESPRTTSRSGVRATSGQRPRAPIVPAAAGPVRR